MKRVCYLAVVSFLFCGCRMNKNSFSKQKYTNLTLKKAQNENSSKENDLVLEENMLELDALIQPVWLDEESAMILYIPNEKEATDIVSNPVGSDFCENEPTHEAIIWEENKNGSIESKITVSETVMNQRNVVQKINRAKREIDPEKGEQQFFRSSWTGLIFFVFGIGLMIAFFSVLSYPLLVATGVFLFISWLFSVRSLLREKYVREEYRDNEFSFLNFFSLINACGTIMIWGALLILAIGLLF